MTRYLGRTDFDHALPLRTGVLITNLGTPAAPDKRALRRYLKQFLSDPRVVEYPRLPWWLILNLVILNLRPARSARSYRKIWTGEGSPLLVNMRRLVERLSVPSDREVPHPPLVRLAMRYGDPSIPDVLREMHDARVHRLLVLPLYPQYSGSTTGSTFDAISNTLQTWRWVPETRFVNSYHDKPRYIDALAAQVRKTWSRQPRGDLLLMSFHGVPKRYLLAGDPYHCQCHATARLLAAKLDLRDEQWKVVFQSRFGREPWLRPYCDETLKSLPSEGVRSVDVVCPGFSVDCLETLEEIGMQNRDFFMTAGGESFCYIPCLNDEPEHRDLVLHLIEEHLCGWAGTGPASDNGALEQRKARATALGAGQ